MSPAAPPRLLLDEHVLLSLGDALRARDVDAVHVLEAGLGGAPDPALLRWCQEEDRILVTRNYRDFAPLVEMLQRRGESFPGLLFLSPGIPQNEPGSHLRALETWLERRTSGSAQLKGTFQWITATDP